MASILDLYGIKEVADVAIIDTVTKAPVLLLDTLKVSTIEETASQSAATGGKGNSQLIVWDYGKEITINLEDALFSMKSMALMHGPLSNLGKTSEVDKYLRFTAAVAAQLPEDLTSLSPTIYDEEGSTVEADSIEKGKKYVAHWKKTVTGDGKNTITVSAKDFPGTYSLVGDTYARNRDTGKDEFFQFVVPLAKMSVEKTITMSADGDPSTFSMTMTVLRPENGEMMKLIKYE